jgi:hypothetical protein
MLYFILYLTVIVVGVFVVLGVFIEYNLFNINLFIVIVMYLMTILVKRL